MKTCHQCSRPFPTGLTCPSCGAFVPDIEVDVEVAATSGARFVHGPRPRTDRSVWTGAAPAVAPGGESGSSRPAPPPAAATIAAARAPAWTKAAAPSVAADPMASLRERAEQRARGPVQPPPPDVAAAAGPSWTRVGPGTPAPSATSATSASPSAPFASGAGGGRSAGRPNVPVPVLAGAAVVVLIVLALAVVVLRPSAPAAGPIATDIVGTCVSYTADRAQVAAAVPCDQPHDGKVLASVPDRKACPAGTSDILTTPADEQGTDGVLCVAKAT